MGLYDIGELGGKWPGAEETLTTQREDESQGRLGRGREEHTRTCAHGQRLQSPKGSTGCGAS